MTPDLVIGVGIGLIAGLAAGALLSGSRKAYARGVVFGRQQARHERQQVGQAEVAPFDEDILNMQGRIG